MTIDEIIERLVPEVDYNPGILPDEAGFNAAMQEKYLARQHSVAEAKIELKYLMNNREREAYKQGMNVMAFKAIRAIEEKSVELEKQPIDIVRTKRLD